METAKTSDSILPRVLRASGFCKHCTSEVRIGKRTVQIVTVTSKTAWIRFSEPLALELAPYGVGVFSIHPGAVRTAMVEAARHIVTVVQHAYSKELKWSAGTPPRLRT